MRAGGGLAISFNGNRHAIKAAEVVVVSDSVWPMALLVGIFRLWGKEGVLEVAAPETRAKSRALVLPEDMIEPIALGLQDHQFNLYMADNPNREKIIQESEAMRARLRGEAIAALGERYWGGGPGNRLILSCRQNGGVSPPRLVQIMAGGKALLPIYLFDGNLVSNPFFVTLSAAKGLGF